MDSHTVVNDWLFDEVMPNTGHAAFKIVCAVSRKTWGFLKEWDEISFSQFSKITGISGRNHISNGIQEAIDKGYIVREKWGAGFRYKVASSNETLLNYVKQLLKDTSTSNEKLPNDGPASNEKLHTKALDIYIQGVREGEHESVPNDSNLWPIKTAISQISSEPFWEKTKSAYDDLALLLFGWDATPEKIAEFGQSWEKHGYYKSKPALSTIAKEYRAWLAGDFPEVKQVQNGHNANGRSHKNELKNHLWEIVTKTHDYPTAKKRASPDEWKILTAMGKWRDVRSLDETKFNIRFYEVYNRHAAGN